MKINLKSILGVVLLAAGTLAGPVLHLPASVLSIVSTVGVAIGGVGVRQALADNQPVIDLIGQGSLKTIGGALALLVAVALSPQVLGLVGPQGTEIIKAAAELLMAIGLVHGVAKTAPAVSS